MIKIAVFLFIATTLLSGCDTISVYRASSLQGEFTDVPTKGMSSRQQTSIDNGQILVRVYVNRFNFAMGVFLEIENRHKTALKFRPWNVTMTGGNGKNLPLESVHRKVSSEKYERVDEKESQFRIEPGAVESFGYDFDGSPVMGFTHITQTDEQKTLHFVVGDLSGPRGPVPVDFVFSQKR